MNRAVRASLHRVVLSRGGRIVEVFGGDPPEWSGFAMADRQPDGALVLAIYARTHRKTGFPAASGRLAFTLLLDAEQCDSAVPAILGEWHSTSDNFKEFKRLRALGQSAADAARGTFTGGEARRHGYTRVVAMDEGDNVVRVRFEPGARDP